MLLRPLPSGSIIVIDSGDAIVDNNIIVLSLVVGCHNLHGLKLFFQTHPQTFLVASSQRTAASKTDLSSVHSTA